MRCTSAIYAAVVAVPLLGACVSVHGDEDVPLDGGTDVYADDIPVDISTDAACDGPPVLDTCEYGLYWADCGGTGPPRAACDRITGECRWFEGGVVPCGHVASDCPADDLCCEPAPAGLGVWPFVDWRPEGRVLAGSLSIDGLWGGVITSSTPPGVVVNLDFTDTPPDSVEVSCAGSASAECRTRLVQGSRSGAAIVLWFRADEGVNLESFALEAWPTPAGVEGRWYERRAPQRDAPLTPSCGRSGVRLLPLEGEVHLSPDAFEHPEAVHGVISGSTPDRGAFTIRF
jgi:hypothetical protein